MSRVFHYFSGEVIELGDRVLDAGHVGYVEAIIQPGSSAGEDHGCPDGGVLVIADWDGVSSANLWTPPDGEYWEDLELLGRQDDRMKRA